MYFTEEANENDLDFEIDSSSTVSVTSMWTMRLCYGRDNSSTSLIAHVLSDDELESGNEISIELKGKSNQNTFDGME